MRVLIGNKLQDAFTPEQEGYISSVRQEERVEGAILTPEAATAAYISQTKWLFIILGGISVAASFGMTLLADPPDQAVVFGGAVSINFALALVLTWMLRRRVRIWNEKLGPRASGLPPVGSKIVADAEGLVAGGRAIPWPTLRIDQVELAEFTTRRVTVYFIERLSLADAVGPVVLDAAMVEKGRLIVGDVWRRLHPK